MSSLFSFAVTGESQLNFLLPGVRDAIAKLRADGRAAGIETAVADFGGARTQAIVTQLIEWRDDAVRKGEPFYRVSPWGKTKHGFGAAADLRVTSRPAGMSEAQAYAKLGSFASKHGLIWGGTFSAPADVYHFESQQSLAQLEPRWLAWQQSAAYPKGFISPTVLVALALVALAIVLVFSHR